MEASIDPNAIAVVGMAGRFPGADHVAAFWNNLLRGEESVEELSEDELRAAGVSSEEYGAANYVKSCAFLPDADLFDAGFFAITPREAELLDPQQRVFLECAWEALEDAGYDPARYAGAIGVFAGSGKNHYYANNLLRNKRIMETMGAVATTIASEKDFVATRVSYKLDLSGPSVSVQTACSTSLVAVHLACQSLLNGESDMALAGGVSISAYTRTGYSYVEGGIFSPDGHLRAFDAQAGGQVGGNGVSIVLLKRLEDALKDGDRIVCLIKGSAINNDGIKKVSFNAPAVDGQANVIAEALEVAGVEAASIGYVECHGTGTHLGDPIEVAALTQAFRASTAARGFCGIGSLKTNVGHLDAAAGSSGLIKAALCLAEGWIPASLHFESPNPELALESSPFYVNAELRAWPRGPEPRRAGVSSFGMGGTNAHVILEEAPLLELAPSKEEQQGSEVLVLSALNAAALDAASERLAAHLASEQGQAQRLADVAHTLQVGRKAFGVRRALLAAGHDEAIQRLCDQRAPKHALDPDQAEAGGAVAFLFSGQGSQYVGMTRGLYEAGGVFRDEFVRACELATLHLGRDLRELIFAEPEQAEAAGLELQKTQYTQPALFIVEYALAKHLASLGILPAAMLGHSIGEYVAACLAGVFSLADAVRLVVLRGRLIGGLPDGGEMLSVSLGEAELQERLYGSLSISVINAPGMCVVSGPADELHGLRERLAADGVGCTALRTSHAFHSALMDPILAEFEAELRGVALSAPKGRVVSCSTGTWLSAQQATDPEYWVRHLREPVRFADGVQTLLAELDCLLEVGPGEALVSLSKLCAQAEHPEAMILPSTRAARASLGDAEVLRAALGQLWCAGVCADWEALRAGAERRRVPLPTYPFQRRRYWIEPEDSSQAAAVKNPNMSHWFWVPSWRRLAPTKAPGDLTGQRWLLYQDAGGLGEALAKALVSAGAEVHEVRHAQAYGSQGAGRYGLNPVQREQHAAVLKACRPTHIVYLMSAEDQEVRDAAGLERETEVGFYGLLALAQALGDDGVEELPLDVITLGMQDVLGALLHPQKAPVLGVVKAIAAELPGVLCRSIDLEPGCADPARRLLQEVCSAAGEGEGPIALAAGQRWTRDVSPAPLAEPDSVPTIKPGALVLISGGLGGIGLSLAEGLARCSQARLLLLGQSAFPARDRWDAIMGDAIMGDAILREGAEAPALLHKLSSIRRMEASGSTVLTRQVDVADLAALRAMLAEVEAEHGAVQAVIHAAGLPAGGLLQLKTAAAAAQVLHAKLQGTQALERALAGRELDYFVLCSSLATQLDAPGQVDYFAANAYLEAEAAALSIAGDERARPTLAIAWEAWRQVGMAVREVVPEALRAGREASLRLGLDPGEGFSVFRRALASGHRQLLISTHDLPRRLQEQRQAALQLRAAPGDEGASQSQAQGGSNLYPRPELSTAFVEPAGAGQLALAELWRDLLGLERVGAEDDFFELGGNSLLLMQVSAGIRNKLEVVISMRELFEIPTLAEVAERIDALRLLKSMTLSAASAADLETEEFRL